MRGLGYLDYNNLGDHLLDRPEERDYDAEEDELLAKADLDVHERAMEEADYDQLESEGDA